MSFILLLFIFDIIITIAGLIYILSPIDLLPEVIPGLGWSDDFFVGMVIAGLWIFSFLIFLISALMPILFYLFIFLLIIGAVGLVIYIIWLITTKTKIKEYVKYKR